VLVRKHERKRALGKPKMDRKLISKWILQEQNLMTWTIHMVQDRDKWWIFIKKVTNLPVSQNVKNFLTSRENVSFSRMTLHHAVQMTPESRAIEAV
jgi:hypothetical protein